MPCVSGLRPCTGSPTPATGTDLAIRCRRRRARADPRNALGQGYRRRGSCAAQPVPEDCGSNPRQSCYAADTACGGRIPAEALHGRKCPRTIDSRHDQIAVSRRRSAAERPSVSRGQSYWGPEQEGRCAVGCRGRVSGMTTRVQGDCLATRRHPRGLDCSPVACCGGKVELAWQGVAVCRVRC